MAITLLSGFYGGIVTPQFVIGAVAGHAQAHVIGADPALAAAVGPVTMLASASNTTIAALLMGVELFGSGAGIGYMAAAVTAYLMIGHRGVYPEQRLIQAKSSWMRIRCDLPVGTEKARLSHGLLRWWHRRSRWLRAFTAMLARVRAFIESGIWP